jgi:1-deoxy-D-xylulose-5-phosphate synthase
MTENKVKYQYLNKINSPADLKALPEEAMPALCREIRHFLVEHVKRTGGHLASNLGVVELTVALHRVFDSPEDRFIFDVGHQSYVHKLLTGRREEFSTLRTPGGLSGFTKRSESEHDSFGAGHSSTSVSAALGFAHADKIAGRDSFSVAILGDGAFTGGMVHEALNNCERELRMIVILNENEMSISRNIGGFAKHIANLRASRGYHKVKRGTQNVLNSIPVIGKPIYNAVRSTKQFVKNSLYSSNYFEEMGLFYLGPADGNDYESVRDLLVAAREKGESSIIHLKTKKGKGYAPAEREPNKYHGISPAGSEEFVNFSAKAGEYLLSLADGDGRICAITAAMCESTGLSPFKKKYPERFFDVGIAEEHALTFSAGLAAGGMHPFFAVYSSFLQRGYDNIIHDIALQGLNVTMLIDRASFSAGDGPTHHGIYDISMLSAVPKITLYAPMSFPSLRLAMEKCASLDSPSAVRYPNSGELEALKQAFGESRDLAPKCDFNVPEKNIIVTYGKITAEALKAKARLADAGVSVGVIMLEQLMPSRDVAAALAPTLEGTEHILFLEESIRAGGVGMMLSDLFGREYPDTLGKIRTDILAIDDGAVFGERGRSLYESAHISADDIVNVFTGGK